MDPGDVAELLARRRAQSKWMRPRLSEDDEARMSSEGEDDEGLAGFHAGWSPVSAGGLVSRRSGCLRMPAGAASGGEFAAIELADDAGDVSAGLGVGRDAVVAVDGGGAGVVGGEREGDVVVVAGEELVEIGGAAGDVLVGREGVRARRGCAAVAGISCIRPRAPAWETARGLPSLSAWTTEASRSASMLWAWPARLRSSRVSAAVSGTIEEAAVEGLGASSCVLPCADAAGRIGLGTVSIFITEAAATSM